MIVSRSILIFMHHSDTLLWCNKCTLCKLLWIKVAAKCPKCNVIRLQKVRKPQKSSFKKYKCMHVSIFV